MLALLLRLLVLLASVLLSGASLTGIARAFDYRREPSPWISEEPGRGPVVLTPYVAEANRPVRPCPPESQVPSFDSFARPLSERPGPVLHSFGTARFSPGYCVHVGDDGRVLSIYLADGSGDARIDRAISGEIGMLRFVAAWHRVLVWLPYRPGSNTVTLPGGPELALHWYVR